GPHPDRVLYLSMEYVPGTDLHGVIGDRPLPLDRVLDVSIQLASGLEAAHASGIVHRDLKPSNVRVTPDGHVKILDFGLARVLRDVSPEDSTSSAQTSDNRVLGTLLYMSPEQAQGQPVDARSDLYSLGVILYQLVTGRLPVASGNALEAL